MVSFGMFIEHKRGSTSTAFNLCTPVAVCVDQTATVCFKIGKRKLLTIET